MFEAFRFALNQPCPCCGTGLTPRPGSDPMRYAWYRCGPCGMGWEEPVNAEIVSDLADRI